MSVFFVARECGMDGSQAGEKVLHIYHGVMNFPKLAFRASLDYQDKTCS